MAQRYRGSRRAARDEDADEAVEKQADGDPPSVDVTGVQRGPAEEVRLDPGADAIREGADEAVPDPSSGDLFGRGSAEEQVKSGESIIERLNGETRAGLAPDLSPGDVGPGTTDLGGVAPPGTDGVEERFGTDGPSIPGVDELGPTRPETPGMDEARSDTHVKDLDDGSKAYFVDSPQNDAWVVVKPDGGLLVEDEAADYIADHIPLEPIPTGDPAEPQVDPEWQERMAESIEQHTHYGEIRMEAIKGSEVNPDPMSDWAEDATVDPTMDPSSPDFADPIDEPIEPVDTIDPADLDPGTIDPIDDFG